MKARYKLTSDGRFTFLRHDPPSEFARGEARRRIEESGLSLQQWSRNHGVDYEAVKAVLLGRLMGLRGEAHRAAVALGLKCASAPEVHCARSAA